MKNQVLESLCIHLQNNRSRVLTYATARQLIRTSSAAKLKTETFSLVVLAGTIYVFVKTHPVQRGRCQAVVHTYALHPLGPERHLVEDVGVEPTTHGVQDQQVPNYAQSPVFGAR